jgi:TetR/AcrR family transcriptional regulator, regulator of cefoperazone and chloramphenicol sensitivity
MARDGSDTREALLSAGQRLFAERGVYQVPLKAIVDAAGQRNASALHYHFENRDGLLQAILERHNATIEEERESMIAAITGESSIRQLVEVFVVPFSRKLETAEGREFLRIVAHLVDLFDYWDVGHDRTPTYAARTLSLLGDRLVRLDPLVRHDRITLFLGLVADGLATHARRLTRLTDGVIRDSDFVANLVDMAVGALAADREG